MESWQSDWLSIKYWGNKRVLGIVHVTAELEELVLN
jgi:hypothetical protein